VCGTAAPPLNNHKLANLPTEGGHYQYSTKSDPIRWTVSRKALIRLNFGFSKIYEENESQEKHDAYLHSFIYRKRHYFFPQGISRVVLHGGGTEVGDKKLRTDPPHTTVRHIPLTLKF